MDARTEAEITAEAVELGLTNQDGSAITTEEQLTAAKEAAAAAAEQPAAPEEDTLLNVALSILKPDEPKQPDAEPAPDAEADKEKNLATLKEWGVEMPADATADQIAAKVAEGKPAAPAPGTPPAAAAPTGTAPAPTAPPTEKPKKKKKFSVVPPEHLSTVEDVPPAAPVAPMPAAPAAAADPDEEYVKTLTDDQREELHEAQVAEMLEPVKYKDQRKKLLTFYREFQATAEQVRVKDPTADLEENEQIRAVAARKPNLTIADQKKVQRKIGADEGKRETLAEINPQLSEMRMTQRRIELEPKFQNFAQNIFKAGVHTLIVNDPQSPVAEAVKLIAEKGADEAGKDFALEVKIYKEEMATVTRRVEQFLLLKNQAIQYNPSNPDPDQRYVMDFVEREGQYLKDYEAKNGRVVDQARAFLPRSEFIKMLHTNPAEAQTLDQRAWKTKSYCTFTDTAIVDMLAKNAKNIIEHRVKASLEEFKQLGLERQPRKNLSPSTKSPTVPPKEVVAPRATPSAIKPPVTPAAPPQNGDTVDVTTTLYAHHKK